MSQPRTEGSLLRHSSRYMGGQGLALLSGLISFPLFTRLLSVEEYGLLTLLSTFILIGSAIGKFGLSNAAIRFHDDSADDKRTYYATHLVGVVIMSTITAAITFAVAMASKSGIVGTSSTMLLGVVAAIVAIRSVQTVMFGYLQAEQNSSKYNRIMVIQKYGALALSLILMAWWLPGIPGFFAGLAIFETGILCYLIVTLIARERFSIKHFSSSLFVKAVKYGLPLVASELAFILFVRIDLYLIGFYLGAYEVGLYSVVYNLGSIIQKLVILPLTLAVMPIYLKKWRDEGAHETSRFLSVVGTYLLLAIVPMVVGISFLAEDIIRVLASDKYLLAVPAVPWVVTGLLIYGLYFLAAAGYYVNRRTIGITLVIVSSLIVNLALNYVLIPRSGIVGAAVATTLSFAFLLAITVWKTRKILPIHVNWKLQGKGLFATALMAMPLAFIQLDNLILDIIIKITVGAIIYIGTLLLISIEIRTKALVQYRALLRQRSLAT